MLVRLTVFGEFMVTSACNRTGESSYTKSGKIISVTGLLRASRRRAAAVVAEGCEED